MQRRQRERRERDDVAERHKDDARDRKNEDEAESDQDIDRSGGDAVDAEDEADVRCHACPSGSASASLRSGRGLKKTIAGQLFQA